MGPIATIIISVLGGLGISGAFFGFLFRMLEKKLNEQEAARQATIENRREFEEFELKTLLAVTALCEANSHALQNGKCNGETHKALAYLDEVKHEQQDFLLRQGVNHLF